MKNNILIQVLSQEARARCKFMNLFDYIDYDSNYNFAFLSVNTLMIAKPDKGRQVEAAIIQMAQTGQLGGKLSEEELVGLLERFAGSSKKTAVKFDRRRNALDSDED